MGPLFRVAYDTLTGVAISPGKFTLGLAIVSILSGFLAYLFSGYVAGKRAQKAGGLHGAMTAVVGAATGAVLGAFGISGGILLALIGLGFGGITASTALALLLAYLFGGYVGGKLGEPSEPRVRRLDG